MKKYLKQNRKFLAALFLVFGVRGTFADQYHIPTGSMEPTIQVGDRVLVNKMAFDLRLPFTDIELKKTGDPQRGDVIVFFHPVSGLRLIKRVIGIPGDHIQVADRLVYVNGQAMEGSAHDVPQSVIVPEGRYFVLGDNRDNSSDSRVWGFVPRDEIQGRALGVIAGVSLTPPWVDFTRTGVRL